MSESSTEIDATPSRRKPSFKGMLLRGFTAAAMALGLSGDRGPQSDNTNSVFDRPEAKFTWIRDALFPDMEPEILERFDRIMLRNLPDESVTIFYWENATDYGSQLSFGLMSGQGRKVPGFEAFGHVASPLENMGLPDVMKDKFTRHDWPRKVVILDEKGTNIVIAGTAVRTRSDDCIYPSSCDIKGIHDAFLQQLSDLTTVSIFDKSYPK